MQDKRLADVDGSGKGLGIAEQGVVDMVAWRLMTLLVKKEANSFARSVGDSY